MTNMQAAVVKEFGKDLIIEQVPIPTPGPGRLSGAGRRNRNLLDDEVLAELLDYSCLHVCHVMSLDVVVFLFMFFPFSWPVKPTAGQPTTTASSVVAP